MTGYLTEPNGRVWQLPPLLEWHVTHTDGDPCGAFTVRFPADPAQPGTAGRALGFQARENGAAVFTGVVDEAMTVLSADGFLTELTGRDLAAKLLDNQVRAAEFQTAQLQDILAAYVRPYGVSRINADAMAAVPAFAVDTGSTCWQALAGFCRHAADIRPRFLADGTLELRKLPAAATRQLTDFSGALSLSLRECRYGVASQVTEVDTAHGRAATAKNDGFLAEGGCAARVVAASGSTLRAGWRTPAQRLCDSARDRRILTAVLPGGFAAWPRDRVAVSLTRPGIRGNYTVRAAETILDEDGLRTVVTMRGDCGNVAV